MNALFQQAVTVIAKQEQKFGELVKAASTDVVFKQEMLYASQAMMNNDYLCNTAVKNPLSLRNAFSQVAACGLTLNPARGLCYLVPRDGQVILDVSYKGMIKTAVNDGAIRDCIVELVYSKDNFKYKGKRHSPIHEFDPFARKEDRGDFLGVYVEVTLPDGRVHVEAVTADEIHKARDASDLWKRKKKGPWLDFEDSMRKKSGIKIAKKYWPMVGEKLDAVIHYLNTDAGEGFDTKGVPGEVVERFMGAAEVVDTVSELPISNDLEVKTQADEANEEDSKPAVEPEAKAEDPAPVEGTVLPAEQPVGCSSELTPPVDVPQKAINKAHEVVKRARLSGGWKAARDYVSVWPIELRDYTLRLLKAEEYQLAREGE